MPCPGSWRWCPAWRPSKRRPIGWRQPGRLTRRGMLSHYSWHISCLGAVMLGLLAGPIISLLVGFLKRVPIVAQHPKTVATILAGVATVLSVIPGVGGPIADIVNQLGGSIGAIAAVAAVSAATAIG